MILLEGQKLSISYERLGGNENGLFVITWKVLESNGTLYDLGVYKCTEQEDEEFNSYAGDWVEIENKRKDFILSRV